MPTLYEQLRGAGCDLDNHESDLYVRATPKAREIVRATGHSHSYFVHQGSGEQWIDVPFAYDPWWQKRAARD